MTFERSLYSGFNDENEDYKIIFYLAQGKQEHNDTNANNDSLEAITSDFPLMWKAYLDYQLRKWSLRTTKKANHHFSVFFK